MKKILGRAIRESKESNPHGGNQAEAGSQTDAADKAENGAQNGNKPEKGSRKQRRGKIRKKHIKWFVLLGIVLIIVVVLYTCSNQARQVSASLAAQVEYTTLEVKDIRNTVSATGIVESADKTNVYSTMSYTVQNILVEVGDMVQEGDVLLELDRASIEKQIKEKELAMENSEASGSQSVKTARDTYNNYKDGMEEGTNSSLISANSSVQTAYDNYQKAIRTCNDYEKTLKQGNNSAVSAQLTAMSNAEAAYRKAEQEYKAAAAAASGGLGSADPAVVAATNARDAAIVFLDQKENALRLALDALSTDTTNIALQNAVTAAEQDRQTAKEALDFANKALSDLTKSDAQINLTAKQQALTSASRALDDAENNYYSALESANNSLKEYRIAIDTAYTAYQTALASRTAAEVAADNQLNAYKNSLETARINSGGDLADYQLEEMRKDLEKASITAPVSGAITAVYATVGAAGNGLLFVIEDINNLIVDTSVKEYDIGAVREGLFVSIKSDATGDEVFSGKITRIAPTSMKNAQGNTDTTGDVKFATEVTVVSSGTPLRIGMSVRLEYIIEQMEQTLSVPYEAVYENAAGQTCVLAAYPQGEKFLLKELVVTTGIENDLEIAISGEGLEPGLRIISAPAGHADGQEVVLSNGAGADRPSGGMMMPGMRVGMGG